VAPRRPIQWLGTVLAEVDAQPPAETDRGAKAKGHQGPANKAAQADFTQPQMGVENAPIRPETNGATTEIQALALSSRMRLFCRRWIILDRISYLLASSSALRQFRT
jgi:hypothetical protein